jgi:putative transposase
VTERYSAIDAECVNRPAEGDAPTIGVMCELLEVSPSGFHDWRKRPESETARRRELLKVKIKALFDFNDEAYGYRRIHQALVRGGESVDDETVRRRMRELGLEPCQPKPWRHSLTEQDGDAGPIPDLVSRDFTAEMPGDKMVGDITYIPTWEGWVYLATVIDCATRKIIGWAMDDNYKTPLIIDAIQMAARNLDLPEGAIFHSDRGSNYTSSLAADRANCLRFPQPFRIADRGILNATVRMMNQPIQIIITTRPDRHFKRIEGKIRTQVIRNLPADNRRHFGSIRLDAMANRPDLAVRQPPSALAPPHVPRRRAPARSAQAVGSRIPVPPPGTTT